MANVGVFQADGLSAAINRRGMMLTVLSQRAVCSRVTINSALSGRPVQLAILVRLAKALDMPLAAISSEAAEAIEAVA